MKNRYYLIVLFAALAIGNAPAMEGLLSPHATDNQTKTLHSFNSDPQLTTTSPSSVIPRLQDNPVQTVIGKSTHVTASLATCVHRVSGTPKMMDSYVGQSIDRTTCCDPASK